MNYLAHMHLSCMDEYVLMGNFVADMISLSETKGLPEKYQFGIEVHRFIDSYTDAHSAVKATTKLFYAHHHKYAPVVTDIVFDYYLARNWACFDHRPLSEFNTHIYQTVKRHLDVCSGMTQGHIIRLIEDDFLMKYTTLEGLDFVFDKMNKRARFKTDFRLALTDMQQYDFEINKLFLDFYPDLLQSVHTFSER